MYVCMYVCMYGKCTCICVHVSYNKMHVFFEQKNVHTEPFKASLTYIHRPCEWLAPPAKLLARDTRECLPATTRSFAKALSPWSAAVVASTYFMHMWMNAYTWMHAIWCISGQKITWQKNLDTFMYIHGTSCDCHTHNGDQHAHKRCQKQKHLWSASYDGKRMLVECTC